MSQPAFTPFLVGLTKEIYPDEAAIVGDDTIEVIIDGTSAIVPSEEGYLLDYQPIIQLLTQVIATAKLVVDLHTIWTKNRKETSSGPKRDEDNQIKHSILAEIRKRQDKSINPIDDQTIELIVDETLRYMRDIDKSS